MNAEKLRASSDLAANLKKYLTQASGLQIRFNYGPVGTTKLSLKL